jgi:hypothetical protein
MMKRIFLYLFSLIPLVGVSQSDPCGFDHIKMMGLFEITEDDNTNYIGKRDAVYTIPVVFHVIHLGEDEGVGTNISDEQILDGLRIINEDLRKMPNTWGDGLGVDVEMELCLAARDPLGNPTNGITRYNGSIWQSYVTDGISYDINQNGEPELNIKNATIWDRMRYLNVWLVSEIQGNDALWGTQGYAYYPIPNNRDGIVLLHNIIGSIGNVKPTHNMSRTFTHEFGHYMGLQHTFEGYLVCESAEAEVDCQIQGDKVCDTPPTVAGWGCSVVCEETNSQYQNYMDYSDQSCRNTFTQGQKKRMRGGAGIMNAWRVSLLSSDGCASVEGTNLAIESGLFYQDCGFSGIKPEVRIQNLGLTPIHQFQVSARILNTPYYVVKSWVSENALDLFDVVTVTFPLASTDYGEGVIIFEILGVDSNMTDNELTLNYESLPSETLSFFVNPDAFPSETTWDMVNVNGDIVWQGGPYSNNTDSTMSYFMCTSNGCYDFTVYDEFGDGFTLGGNFELINSSGDTLAYGVGNFGNMATFNFCLDVQFQEPCIDLGYNGICDDEEIGLFWGCLDSLACNYNYFANLSNSSCVFSNGIYDCFGNCLVDSDWDGVCDELEIFGCVDPSSCNYNEEATENFGCQFPFFGYSCEGVPLSMLNTVTSIMELSGSDIVESIVVFDVLGRPVYVHEQLSEGLYFLHVRLRDSSLSIQKIYLIAN